MLETNDRTWIDGKFDDLRKEIVKVQIDVATLKVKASVWGLMGGLLPAMGVLIYALVKI